MKLALKAAAKLAGINLRDAATMTRRNALFNEEIHIDEELINLEESIATARVADSSLRGYPKLRQHMLQEQRLVIKHCAGLLDRMMQGRRLPREYSERDTTYALTRFIRLMVDEAIRVEKKIDDEILEIVKPFLTFRQRLELREWDSINIKLYSQLLWRKLSSFWLFGRA